MEAVFGWVQTYGYGALFGILIFGIVGLPVPDETLLVFCGYLISQGKLTAVGTLAAAVGGSWCGISVSYGIGRTLGLGVVHRFGRFLHVNDQQLERVHAWFDRRGRWALFFGYYIAGVRHLTAIIAGASKLDFVSFIRFAWTGALCWALVFLSLGYFIGEQWRRAAELVHAYLTYVSVALILLVILFFVARRFWRKRSVNGTPAP
jgi:membrane protein DedA with SNARE-associated domain